MDYFKSLYLNKYLLKILCIFISLCIFTYIYTIYYPIYKSNNTADDNGCFTFTTRNMVLRFDHGRYVYDTIIGTRRVCV